MHLSLSDLVPWLQGVSDFGHTHYVLALFLLLLIEEAGVPLPLPGDLVIAYAGYRAANGEASLLVVAFVVILAVQAGAGTLYVVSRRLGRALLHRCGRFVHLDAGRVAKVEGWLQRHGAGAVLVGRLTPGLRTPTSVMAGVFAVPPREFLFYAGLSAIIWCSFWLTMGYLFGESLITLIERSFHTSPSLALAALVLVGAAALTLYWRRKRAPASA